MVKYALPDLCLWIMSHFRLNFLFRIVFYDDGDELEVEWDGKEAAISVNGFDLD